MKAAVLVVLGALGAGVWAYHTFSVHGTPEGQPPLAVLEEASPAIQAFNDNASQFRLLALLSPT